MILTLIMLKLRSSLEGRPRIRRGLDKASKHAIFIWSPKDRRSCTNDN